MMTTVELLMQTYELLIASRATSATESGAAQAIRKLIALHDSAEARQIRRDLQAQQAPWVIPLPVSAWVAPPPMPGLPVRNREQTLAQRESETIAASDAYFEARPLDDGAQSRRLFEAGFIRGAEK